jgi:tRNA (guanine37-N1)-methyltransferase
LKLDIALVHYPVLNKKQEIIGSAVTNLDIHDIARAGKTYGVNNFYIVTPFTDQQKLVGEIIEHWLHGYGAVSNSDRCEAFSLIKVCSSLEDLFDKYVEHDLRRPLVVATSARNVEHKQLSYAMLRQRLLDGEHCLLLFGTGWGLAPDVMADVDAFLPPVGGGKLYNHLSVRSACSIILDRLLGES